MAGPTRVGSRLEFQERVSGEIHFSADSSSIPFLNPISQKGLKGSQIVLNQAKTLGGSSAVNAQNLSPPTQKMIDAWDALGKKGWDWKTLRPFYAKSYTPPSIAESQKKGLGREGWEDDHANGSVQLSFPESPNPFRPLEGRKPYAS